MVSELKAAKPDLNIEIIGINQWDEVSGNPGLTDLITFPWLQDSLITNVWASWQAVKDDLFVVDSLGRQQNRFPIGRYDLIYPTNRENLKQMLLSAAVIHDQGGDSLPDDWVQQYFGATPAGPGEDPDADGRDNCTEYAFGTNPTNPKSALPMQVKLVTTGLRPELLVTFRRRAGSVLDYYLETSIDLVQWTPVTSATATVSAPVNLYDGTGTSEVRVTLKLAPGDPLRWVRVRAVPRRL